MMIRSEEPFDRMDSAFGTSRGETVGVTGADGRKAGRTDLLRRSHISWDENVVGGDTTYGSLGLSDTQRSGGTWGMPMHTGTIEEIGEDPTSDVYPPPDDDGGVFVWTEADLDAWENIDRRPSIHVDASTPFKLYLFYVLILADILVDAFTEPFRTDDIVIHVLTFSFQIFVKLATLMAFCLLTTEILYIKMALYEEYFHEFRSLFLTALVAFTVFFGVRSWNLFMIYDGIPPMAMWTMYGNLYMGMYTTSRLVNLVYYAVLVFSAHVACSERLYTDECLKR